ncbi:quinon protein alcohol dehydrogenase-like superfamily [Suillus americanus]|nr:quinon protein alcohol dehydrogenase-like superfamily [Suillus americanus]
MASSSTEKTSVITPRHKFEGHTDGVWGVIHLPGGQRIITCSYDGSLRAWNLKSGKQIGDDWRDGGSKVVSIALSPDGKKVVSGSEDSAVRLWDIDTCKVIAKWTGHTNDVVSVCWSRDGRRVLSGSDDGTARQWDVETGDEESGETILASIKTGHKEVWAVVYSPDMTLIATGGRDGPATEELKYSIQIWDAKTGKLVATLKGHTEEVRCLAWTKNGKTLISGSFDNFIRIWDTTKWEQTAVLDEHTDVVFAIAISPNGRILASASFDKTARLWNLDNGQPINSPLPHAESVESISFSENGKLLATGCNDKNAYLWDVVAIVRGAGLDELLSDSKANKSPLHVNATRRLIQQRPLAYQVPHGFFDGVPSTHSSAPQETTHLRRLFHRSPSSAQDTSRSSPIDWARNLFKRRAQRGEIELQGRSPAVAEVPYAKGKRRNASAREVALAKQKQKTKLLHSKNSTGGSQPPKPNVAKPFLQPQAADSSSSTTPAIGDATTATSTTSAPSRPDIMIRQAGLWTRFWLLMCFGFRHICLHCIVVLFQFMFIATRSLCYMTGVLEQFFCTIPHTIPSPFTIRSFYALLDHFKSLSHRVLHFYLFCNVRTFL